MSTEMTILFKTEIDIAFDDELKMFINNSLSEKVPIHILKRFTPYLVHNEDRLYLNFDFLISILYGKYEEYGTIILCDSLQWLQKYSQLIKLEILALSKPSTEKKPEEMTMTIKALREMTSIPINVKIDILVKTKIFYVEQVEVMIGSLLEINNQALGYLRNYFIASKDIDETFKLIVNDIQEDEQFTGVKKIFEVGFWALPQVIRDDSDYPTSSKILYRSERIYFSD